MMAVVGTTTTMMFLITQSIRSTAFQSARQLHPQRQVGMWRSASTSGATGRTCFRHNAGDLSSWRISSASSGDDTSAAVPTTVDLSDYSNKNNLDDQVFSAISADGGLKVTVCTTRNLVNEFMIQHTMNAVPGDALGRATITALLASNGMQAEQMFQLTLKGDGPLRGCCAVVNGKGGCKGYVGTPALGDVFTLPQAIGQGTVQVVKNHPDWPNPYNGITAIRHGDIDRDVGIYLAESEQRSCALAAGTAWNGILCTAAGGYLVERLPDCPPETMRHMEGNLAKLVELNGEETPLPTALLLNGMTPVDIASILLDGLGMEASGSIEPKPECECSEEKLFRSLRLLPREEVDSIIAEQGKVEARCHFCGAQYELGPDDVASCLDSAEGDASKDEEWKEEMRKRRDN